MSIAVVQGPSLETCVRPTPLLVKGDDRQMFRGMKYRDYVEFQQKNRLEEKSILDVLRSTGD